MQTVLGIDAAWTATEPTGVALVERCSAGHRWRCVALAPSYDAFIALSEGTPVSWHTGAFHGSASGPDGVLDAARRLTDGQPVTLVTVDMPVATVPIIGRRRADALVSSQFGGRGCSTHSPSPQRPGPIGERLTDSMAAHGFEIADATTACGAPARLLEVYPHPALLVLLGVPYRFGYKVSKSRRLWRGTPVEVRVQNLLVAFDLILAALRTHIDDIALDLPAPSAVSTLSHLKRYEDALDALVSAWVGIEYLEGRAQAYGDATAAIWVPTGPGFAP